MQQGQFLNTPPINTGQPGAMLEPLSTWRGLTNWPWGVTPYRTMDFGWNNWDQQSMDFQLPNYSPQQQQQVNPWVNPADIFGMFGAQSANPSAGFNPMAYLMPQGQGSMMGAPQHPPGMPIPGTPTNADPNSDGSWGQGGQGGRQGGSTQSMKGKMVSNKGGSSQGGQTYGNSNKTNSAAQGASKPQTQQQAPAPQQQQAPPQPAQPYTPEWYQAKYGGAHPDPAALEAARQIYIGSMGGMR